MYWVAAIILLILLLAAGSFCTFYFPIKKPTQHHHHHHHDDQNQSEHKALKRSVADIHLKTVFATFDKNSDEFITKQELMESLKNIGIAMSESDVDDMIKRVDANGDGLIDLDEFCESFDGSLIATEGEFREIFDVFDGDEDGFITVDELGLVLTALGFEEGKKKEDCKEMIDQFDLDGDGTINFLEFKKMMIKSGHKLVPVD